MDTYISYIHCLKAFFLRFNSVFNLAIHVKWPGDARKLSREWTNERDRPIYPLWHWYHDDAARELSEKFAEKNLTFALIANAREIRISCALASLRSRSKSIPWGLWMRANGLQDEEKKSVKRNEKEVMQDKQLRYLCLLILFSTFWRTIFGRFYLHKMQDKVWENWLEHFNSTEPSRALHRSDAQFKD